MSEVYCTVEGEAQAEIVEKKSRFIGRIRHVDTEEEALSFLDEVRTEHRMARHNVYAYILRGGRVRYSDDGEPSQTAGMPTLEVLQHAGLQDVAVVVTRYFGGVLLGTGGLVRAYTQATQAAVEAANVVVISRCVDMAVEVSYPLYEPIARYIEETPEAKVIESDFGASVMLTIRILDGYQDGIQVHLQELTRGEAEVLLTPAFDAAF